MMDDRLVSGRYSIKELIGEGGIARIYRAVDISSGEDAAIKEIKQPDQTIARSFEREFLFASLNRHPALMAPLSYLTENDIVMIAWPYIRGADLRTVQAAAKSDQDRIARIIVSILECAAFIHHSGHVYNDFKPDNIILPDNPGDESGGGLPLKLIDYNLVSVKGESASKRGTINYIAPEIFSGVSPAQISDIYSLGVLFYEMLTGRLPFANDDNDLLIKKITENGAIDFSEVPDRFKAGLESMLHRRPESRPRDSREAAKSLGLGGSFYDLYRLIIDYYLSSGPTAFHAELSENFEDYLGGMSWKVFWIKALNHNGAAMNFLEARYGLRGFRIRRILSGADKRFIGNVLDDAAAQLNDNPDNKTMLLIDDVDTLDSRFLARLRTMSGPRNGLAVAIGASRWSEPPIPASVFDPLQNTTRKGATETALKAILKKETTDFGFADLARYTCGDPPLVHAHLKQAVLNSGLDLLAEDIHEDLSVDALPGEVLESAMGSIVGKLSRGRQSILQKLSAWGDSIPMLILGALHDAEQREIDALLKSGHLVAGKDAVAFSSGDARDYIYFGLSDAAKTQHHRFWAEAVDDRMADSDGHQEYSAFHWGESDDAEKGFNSNLRAASELLAQGELSRAAKYGEKAQLLAARAGGHRTGVAAVCASIYKEAGDYKSARRNYLELLRLLKVSGEKTLEAKTYKDLGDLYRSIKKIKKAVYYTSEALQLYEQLGDQQGIADCNNNIGLTYWIDEQFDSALESFQRAFDANMNLNNHRELAKIQSNRAIIKDITGKTREVAGFFLEARDHAAEANDPRMLALISNNLGYFYIRQGEYDKAVKYLQEAVSASEKIGYSEGVINALSNLGLCHLRSGDLFTAVDNNQKALETAEALGSRHLAASAELYLTEACILMGNFQLADSVLQSIESGKAFAEDKSLKPQVDLLRSRLYLAVGLRDKAAGAAESVSKEADSIGDERLRLEALLYQARADSNRNKRKAVSQLAEVVDTTSRLGHGDLMTSAGISLAEIYLSDNDLFNSESWLERADSAPNPSRESMIRMRILESEINRARKKYDDGLKILFEGESTAAVSGYVPLALQSSVVAAGIFLECRKLSRAGQTLERAVSYRSRLHSALPQYASPATMETLPYINRIREIAEAIKKKEFLRV